MARGRHKNTALVHALRELADRLPEWWQQLPAVLEDIVRHLLVPVAVGLLVAAVVGYLGTRLYRRFVPFTAVELHHQALQQLHNSSSHNNSNSKTKQQQQTVKKYEQRAEQLLFQAMETDPNYEPAVLSLAALYIYRQRDSSKALTLLESRIQQHNNNNNNNSSTSTSNNNSDSLVLLQGLWLDAKAVRAGQFQMVQAELREAEFLPPALAAVTPTLLLHPRPTTAPPAICQMDALVPAPDATTTTALNDKKNR